MILNKSVLSIHRRQVWCRSLSPPRCMVVPTTVLCYSTQNNILCEEGSREGLEEMFPCRMWDHCWCSQPENALTQVSLMHRRCFSLSA